LVRDAFGKAESELVAREYGILEESLKIRRLLYQLGILSLEE
jgi:hypothetical protein